MDLPPKTYPNAYVFKVETRWINGGYRPEVWLGPYMLWQDNKLYDDREEAKETALAHMVYALSRLLFIANEG